MQLHNESAPFSIVGLQKVQVHIPFVSDHLQPANLMCLFEQGNENSEVSFRAYLATSETADRDDHFELEEQVSALSDPLRSEKPRWERKGNKERTRNQPQWRN